MLHPSPHLQWRKSSHSDAEGQCVEIAEAGDAIAVRDSKQGDTGPVLSFTRAGVAGLIADLKTGARHR